MGKHRTIEDAHGKPLFSLDRNWTSKKRAWVLKSGGLKPDADVLMAVEYGWVHRKISMKASRAEVPIASVQANDNAGGHLRITSGEATMATMQCQNMTTGYFTSLMVTPPTWSIDVTPGVDLCLITVLAICVSDAFSENRILML